MVITMKRVRQSKVSTIGAMQVGNFEVFTLEDPHRDVKVKGDTRIPAGRYKIKLRDEGGMTNTYRKMFGADWHKGMLWLQDVPNFEFIYIHVGNSPKDTLGCILVGMSASNDYVHRSRDAYRAIYPPIRDAILAGEEVIIEVEDER